MRRVRFRVVPGLLLAAIVWSPTSALSQIGPSHWDPDERVLVTSFQRVTALARSPSRLFAATDAGLVIRDDAFGRWDLPVTREDGYPNSRILALSWDPRDRTLWLATEDARLIQLDPHDRRFLDDIRLTQAVNRIIPSPDDLSAMLVRQGTQWFSMDSFSRRMTIIDPRDADRAEMADLDLARRRELLGDTRFQAGRSFIAVRGSSTYSITDVMPTARLGTFWISSYGGFLFEYDSFTGESRPIDYGLVGTGAGVVFAEDSTVWFAPGAQDGRYAISMADTSLDSWRTWEEASIGPTDRNIPSDRIRAIIRIGEDLWFGGDRGVYRFDGSEWHREAVNGLGTGTAVLSLAAGTGDLQGLWLGTDRGLYRLRRAGAPVEGPWLPAREIRAVAAQGARVWLGTDAGLAFVGMSAGQPTVSAADAGPRGAVWSLASHGNRLYAGMERGIWWLDSSVWHQAESLGVITSPVTALEVEDGIVWLGSSEGVTMWDTRSSEQRRYSFGAGDLVAGDRGETHVTSISTATPNLVWVATPAGVIRLTVDR